MASFDLASACRALAAALLLATCQAMATTDGIAFTSVASQHEINKTIDRVRAEIDRRGLTIFREIDHAANAQQVGKSLRPTYLMIFGSVEVGTRVMNHCAQSTGLDLPLKMLVWQDEEGSVWISYNKWTLLDMRHEFSNCRALLDDIEDDLAEIADAAAH